MGGRRVAPLMAVLALLAASAIRQGWVPAHAAGTVSECDGPVGIYGDVGTEGIFCGGAVPGVVELLKAAGAEGCAAGDQAAGGASFKVGTKATIGKSGGSCRIIADRFNGAELLSLGLKLDLNEVSAEDLEALPGIGPSLAVRIVEHRTSYGPFKDIESLKDVRGIGPATLARVAGNVTVSGSKGR